MDVTYWVAVLVFLCAALLVEGLFTIWRTHHGPAAKQIERRLHEMSESHVGQGGPLLKQRMMSRKPGLDRLLQAVPGAILLERLLRQAASELNVAQFLWLSIVGVVLGTACVWATRLPAAIVLLGALLGGAVPALWLVRARSVRLAKIDRQLPDVMDLMSRALRAGHSFSSALQMAGSEAPEPIAREFRIVFDEISFGVTSQDALAHLAARVPSDDLRYLVVAVVTQRETGGNLAELLGNTAALIRSRHKLLGSVRVLATEGRLSAWILVVLPFALAAALYTINPEFVSALWKDPVGFKMVVSAVIAMIVGVFWMSRVVKIRV